MVLGIDQTIGDLIVRRRFVGIYIKEIVISFIAPDGTGNQRARPLAALFLYDHCCQDVRIDIGCLSYRIDKRSVIAVTFLLAGYHPPSALDHVFVEELYAPASVER